MSAFSRRTFMGTAVAAAGSYAALRKVACAVAKPALNGLHHDYRLTPCSDVNFHHFPQPEWSVILVFCGPQQRGHEPAANNRALRQKHVLLGFSQPESD